MEVDTGERMQTAGCAMRRTRRFGPAMGSMLTMVIAIGLVASVHEVAASSIESGQRPLAAAQAESSASASADASASPSAAATPTRTPTPTPTPTEAATPAPSTSPSASAGPICGPDTHFITPQRVLAGTRVTGWFTRFEPDATVAIIFRPDYVDFPERAIGTSTTDEHGYGEIDVVIPADAPIGNYALLLRLDECATSPWPEISISRIAVVPVLPEISVSDDTVLPGQRVTIRATGFNRDDTVYLTLDNPEHLGLECTSCLLATGQTNSEWSVVITVRLPRDLSPGSHILTLFGWGPELLFPEELEVVINVGAASQGRTSPTATLPPTDTVLDAPPDPFPAGWPTVLVLLAGFLAASLLVVVRRPARRSARS